MILSDVCTVYRRSRLLVRDVDDVSDDALVVRSEAEVEAVGLGEDEAAVKDGARAVVTPVATVVYFIIESISRDILTLFRDALTEVVRDGGNERLQGGTPFGLVGFVFGRFNLGYA